MLLCPSPLAKPFQVPLAAPAMERHGPGPSMACLGASLLQPDAGCLAFSPLHRTGQMFFAARISSGLGQTEFVHVEGENSPKKSESVYCWVCSIHGPVGAWMSLIHCFFSSLSLVLHFTGHGYWKWLIQSIVGGATTECFRGAEVCLGSHFPCLPFRSSSCSLFSNLTKVIPENNPWDFSDSWLEPSCTFTSILS